MDPTNRYRIQHGSFDDFIIDNQTGLITIARKLDYDKRENYRVEVVASDLGKFSIHSSNFKIEKHFTFYISLCAWIECYNC